METTDLWFVEERLRAQGISAEDATERTREMQRFLALSAEHGELPMISPAVDEAWHAFLLFTREYEEYCRTQFGRFLHHHPGSSGSMTPEQFVETYRQAFGVVPPVWTSGRDCGSGGGPSCSGPVVECGTHGEPGGRPEIALFDWTPVATRLVSKGSVPADRIDEVLTELQRYLQLAAVHGPDVNVHSPLVDAAWHELILFTAEYSRYCQARFGRFIHHRPFTSRTIAKGASRDEFVRRYESAFGVAVPSLWLQGYDECGACDSCSSH